MIENNKEKKVSSNENQFIFYAFCVDCKGINRNKKKNCNKNINNQIGHWSRVSLLTAEG